ncbi:DUF2007 domain-containing protein [Bacteroidales bacterium OttesenSCG-928-M11]|nr:DUF2007 domain-containing protein [Bacteroidales bacterium OttesenSCG-928-M11]
MKLVEVAIFTFPSDAAVFESILSAEGIEHALNNQNSAIIVPGNGVTISVREKDRERAYELLNEAGFKDHII